MPEPGTTHCGGVALVGRPNVGKSTLLNRMLGQKLVITSHKAQTTRHAILGIKSRPDGQILFLDTPGIHRRGGSALNRYLNRLGCCCCLIPFRPFLPENKAAASRNTPHLFSQMRRKRGKNKDETVNAFPEHRPVRIRIRAEA